MDKSVTVAGQGGLTSSPLIPSAGQPAIRDK